MMKFRITRYHLKINDIIVNVILHKFSKNIGKEIFINKL